MAYNKIVSDNYGLWIKSPEGIKLYLHSEAPSASTALGDISGLREFMTPSKSDITFLNKSGLFSCPDILSYCHSVCLLGALSIFLSVYLSICLLVCRFSFLTSC